MHANGHEDTLTAMGQLAAALLQPEAGGEALEEAVALLSEELRSRLATQGDGCIGTLPQLTSALIRRLYDALMQEPNLGADVEGYE